MNLRLGDERACCLKYRRYSSSTSTRFRKYFTENLSFTFLKVGVRPSKPDRNNRIGIDSPAGQSGEGTEGVEVGGSCRYIPWAV